LELTLSQGLERIDLRREHCLVKQRVVFIIDTSPMMNTTQKDQAGNGFDCHE
jgi:hypothetical protein